jgi:putative ABC transport system permease protein
VNVAILESGDTALVSGWPMAGFMWETLPLVTGRRPGTGEAILSEELAREQRLAAGDRLVLEGHPVTVSGTFRATGALLRSGIVLELATMQELWSRNGSVTFLLARLERPEDGARTAEILARLRARFPLLRISESDRVAEDNRVLEILSALNRTTSLVAMLMGFVVVLNTLLMAVLERTRELGLLSALGWPPRRILAVITLEGVLVSLLGGAAGSLLGVAGLHWVAGASALRGFVEPEVDPRTFVEAAVAAVGLGVLGALYPAWRAIRLDPVAALRDE